MGSTKTTFYSNRSYTLQFLNSNSNMLVSHFLSSLRIIWIKWDHISHRAPQSIRKVGLPKLTLLVTMISLGVSFFRE